MFCDRGVRCTASTRSASSSTGTATCGSTLPTSSTTSPWPPSSTTASFASMAVRPGPVRPCSRRPARSPCFAVRRTHSGLSPSLQTIDQIRILDRFQGMRRHRIRRPSPPPLPVVPALGLLPASLILSAFPPHLCSLAGRNPDRWAAGGPDVVGSAPGPRRLCAL